MEEKKEEALNYAVSSNKLEEHNVTPKEFQEILDSLDNGDKSFLLGVLEYVKNKQDEKKEDNTNDKTRK